MGGGAACPVCRGDGVTHFLTVDEKAYWRCTTCEARFLDARHFLAPEAELSHYRLHENHVEDEGYRRFLARLATPLMQRLSPDDAGLDYGCGPGPALAAMLREAGYTVALFDPFFAPDAEPLAATYDFITCTEVAEHFHAPALEFDRLDAMLKPGGLLAVMTCFQTDDDRFAAWHYRKDPTHVTFYRPQTFREVAAQRGWSCEIPVKDVALMRKPLRKAG